MNHLMIAPEPFENQKPTRDQIASLAWKFYMDSHGENGFETENWLCAEYMLNQKQLIELQVSALHGKKYVHNSRPASR